MLASDQSQGGRANVFWCDAKSSCLWRMRVAASGAQALLTSKGLLFVHKSSRRKVKGLIFNHKHGKSLIVQKSTSFVIVKRRSLALHSSRNQNSSHISRFERNLIVIALHKIRRIRFSALFFLVFCRLSISSCCESNKARCR
jgi:hypothetical protein